MSVRSVGELSTPKAPAWRGGVEQAAQVLPRPSDSHCERSLTKKVGGDTERRGQGAHIQSTLERAATRSGHVYDGSNGGECPRDEGHI